MKRDPAPLHPLIDRLIDARRVTDSLFAIVKPEFLYERPIRERHRIVFYIGHLEAFDRNLFDGRLFALPPVSAELDQLFAFGIDPVDGGFPTDQPADWPTLDIVRGYGRQVREQIDAALASLELTSQRMQTGSAEQLLHVAIEHRLMHAETLAYMLHQLPLHQKQAPEGAVPALVTPGSSDATAQASAMVQVPAGSTVLGMPKSDGKFGWDNEFGALEVDVPAFEIDRQMVTNGAFRAFLEAGGYTDRRHWTDADWAWKEDEGIAHPAGWSNASGHWTLRTMFEELPLPESWPVYVSQAEAAAFAHWAGKSLPTEAQWQRAAHDAPHASADNADFRYWDPRPVNADTDATNVSAFGVEGQYGNGWEWTSTVFDALPGFEAFPFYLGYSANFFDGKHYVIKGGSARTARCMLRPTFRNWFQGHYQFVYAGFRCVSK